MNNLRLILEESGSDLRHILKVNIYLSDIFLGERIHTAYVTIMGEHKPARAIIPSPELHYVCGLYSSSKNLKNLIQNFAL